jgi:hypothetical protein
MRLRVHGETNRATRMRRRFYAEDCVTRLLASIVMVIGRLILRCVGMGGHYLCDRQLTNMAEQGEKHEDEDRGTEDHGTTIAAAPFSVKPRCPRTGQFAAASVTANWQRLTFSLGARIS